MRFSVGLLVALACLFLGMAACSKPSPPVGKWEGGMESGGDLVVARVEILPGGQVKIMAPDITNAIGAREQMNEFRARLSADLANGWSEVKPRSFEFDGKTFRKPGGIAIDFAERDKNGPRPEPGFPGENYWDHYATKRGFTPAQRAMAKTYRALIRKYAMLQDGKQP